MAEIIWSEPALNELDEIAEYIALSNLSAAQSLVKAIFRKVDRLEQHPLSGRKPPELESFNYREIIANPCRIFYKVESDKVYILHIMRQEQQLKMYLFDN